MKNVSLSYFLFALFFFSFYSVAHAELTYQRTPTGLGIVSPVSFYVSFDTTEDLSQNPNDCAEASYWQILLWKSSNVVYQSPSVAISITEKTFVIPLPVGTEIDAVEVACLNESHVGLGSVEKENDNGLNVFVIVQATASSSALVIPVDFWDGIYLLISVLIFMWWFGFIIKTFKR